MTQNLPSSCAPEQLIQDWCDAVDAYHRQDFVTVATMLFPTLSDQETYTRTVGFTIVAAALCGEAIRERLHGTPTGLYGLEARNGRTGQVIDPNDSVGAANALTAGRLLVAAANQDSNLVKDIVLGHMPPGSDPERFLVLENLLVIYCAEVAS